MHLDGRQKAYLALRGAAALAFLLSAVVLPRGPLAAAVCIGSGLVAVMTCLSVNAGGPGERAGARAQARTYEKVRPPQGDWPPFDPDRVVDGELARAPRSRRSA